MPTSNQLFQPISDIIKPSAIPGDIAIIEDGIEQLLSKLFYKDATISSSPNGEELYAHLRILSAQELGFEIGGTGLRLILNANPDNTPGSSFPISFRFYWEVLKYRNSFDFTSFDNGFSGIFDVLKDIAQFTDEELLTAAINTFIGGNNSNTEFVNRFNQYLILPDPIKLTDGLYPEEHIGEITRRFGQENIEVSKVILDLFLANSSSLNDFWTKLKQLLSYFGSKLDEDRFKRLITPGFQFSLDSINAAIEFPESIFKPVDPSISKSKLTFDIGRVVVSSEDGFDFQSIGNFEFTESNLFNTGFTLGFTGARLDLSRKKNIPEAIADGRPDDFMGVYIQDGVIGFPTDWGHDNGGSTGQLYVHNFLAGTGGISGTIGLRAKPSVTTSPFISVKFGEKFKASLTSFDITFQQNAIIESNILGTLEIPGFKDASGNQAVIDIKIHFGTNGDFNITVSEQDGIELPLHFDEYFRIIVKSLSVGKRNGKFFLATAGVIDFNDVTSHSSFIGNNLPKDIEIQKLLIWENGEIEMEGGAITLRKPIAFKLGPVKLSITALGMGSYERQHNGQLRKYKYIEFSAGLSIKPGGIDARGDGIKIYFSSDNGPGKPLDIFVRIQSISIDLIIPGSASKDQATLLLSGYLSMKEPTYPGSNSGTEYAGGIDFKLPKLKMGGSAAMKYNPDIPSFLIDVSLELSTPIVLGATGMGIYGFRALFGKQYVVSRTEAPVSLPEDAEWWQYYKKKVNPEQREGVTTSKMANLQGFSFGAGLSLASAMDGGKVFSSKLFFLLSLPEVFLLQGQAQILKNRIGLDTTEDPPFFAIIAIDRASVSAGMGLNYRFPDDGDNPGKIATVDALIEMAYFWHDSSAWYLNVGRDTPDERRIRGRIFDLFDVYVYFMLSAKGIRAGAGASFDKTYKLGPIKAHLYAYLDVAGRIAFKPVQIGGSIDIGGGVDITICGKGFGLTAAASLAAEAPRPFIVTGSVEVCLKFLKKEYCIDLDFTWTFENSLDFSEVPVVTRGLISQGGAPSVSTSLQQSVKALNIMSQETLNVLCIENISTSGASSTSIPLLTNSVWSGINNYILPLDSFIDIEFVKPVKPNGNSSLNKFGGVTSGPNYSIFVSPQRGKSNRVRHDFVLNKVEVFSWNPTGNGGSGSWDEYHVYNAITPLTSAPFNLTSTDLNNLKFGSWQIDSPGNYTKLRLMAQNPLSFLSQGTGDTIPEELGTTNAIFCPPVPRNKTCVNFDSYVIAEGKSVAINAEKIIQQQSVLMRVTSHVSNIINQSFSGVNKALAFNYNDTLEIYLPDSMSEVSLLLGTTSAGVTIKYYNRIQTGTNSSGNPVYGYALITTVNKTAAQLSTAVSYLSTISPVDKIEITGGSCERGNCLNYFYQVCYMNVIDSNYNQSLPSSSDVTQSNTTMADAINKTLVPVWRPDTIFAVRVQYTDEVYEETSSYSNNSRAFVFGFRTKGPIGHYHEYPTGNTTSQKLLAYEELEERDNEDQFKLATLKNYIDYSKSYPNADGNIINAKPLYYEDPELLLFYAFPHVYQFYQNWNAYNGAGAVDSSLEVLIKDPAEPILVNDPLNPSGPQIPYITPAANNAWEINAFPRITTDIAALNSMISNASDSNPCKPAPVPLTPKGINNKIKPGPLLPLKLYNVIYNAVYKPSTQTEAQKREVHRYGFQTSRYKDFNEHINSYILLRNEETSAVERTAVYKLEKAFSPAIIAKAEQVLAGTLPKNDPLHQEAAIDFDKLIDRLFEFKELEPAEFLQFNFIIDTNTGHLLGVLLRSPEPFNDPKTPLSELLNTIQMTVDTGARGEYKALFSKDRASVFITRSTNVMNVAQGNHKFSFLYKLYNGNTYEIRATEEIVVNFNTIQ